MKAIIIARVSTEEQKEAGLSLPAQVARLEKYCQNKNFNIMRICSFDESTYKDQRNEFDAIIDFILEQKEKIVVCCDKVDRLTRNMFDKLTREHKETTAMLDNLYMDKLKGRITENDYDRYYRSLHKKVTDISNKPRTTPRIRG